MDTTKRATAPIETMIAKTAKPRTSRMVKAHQSKFMCLLPFSVHYDPVCLDRSLVLILFAPRKCIIGTPNYLNLFSPLGIAISKVFSSSA